MLVWRLDSGLTFSHRPLLSINMSFRTSDEQPHSKEGCRILLCEGILWVRMTLTELTKDTTAFHILSPNYLSSPKRK